MGFNKKWELTNTKLGFDQKKWDLTQKQKSYNGDITGGNGHLCPDELDHYRTCDVTDGTHEGEESFSD